MRIRKLRRLAALPDVPSRFRGIIIFQCLLLTALIAASPDICLPQAEDTGIYQLGEVVVSEAKPAVESAGTVREITAEDIQNRGARSLDEAIIWAALIFPPSMKRLTSSSAVAFSTGMDFVSQMILTKHP